MVESSFGKVKIGESGKEAGIEGIGLDELKVSTTLGHLLREILVELKINNKYLSEIVSEKITEKDIQ